MASAIKKATKLSCDYLVVGGGAASIAFVDTLLTQIPSAKIVLVDKKQNPGGQWNDAYDFVKLHQPSIVYGIESKSLEGNWLKLMMRHLTLPWNHRATKAELLRYFQVFIDEKVGSGQLEYFSNSIYDFEQEVIDDVHKFSSLDGEDIYSVEVKEKLVNGVLGECKVPSQTPVAFPVDDGVNLLTPNELFDKFQVKKKKVENKNKKYVVLGFGKTGMDTIVYLQRTMKVKPERITWVLPNDVWMTSRGGGSPSSWAQALLKEDGDEEKARLKLESEGIFVRLDKNVTPTRFRFPVIGKDELALMRKIPNLIRRGRVTSIEMRSNDEVQMSFGEGYESYVLPSASDTVFIHCTSPGPFNGVAREMVDHLYVSEKVMHLHLLFAPPVSVSMSCLAYLEAARKKGTLNLNFGRELVRASLGNVESCTNTDEIDGNAILHNLIRGFGLDTAPENVSTQFKPILNMAMVVALADSDPLVGLKWMQSNRLSMLSIPGSKSRIYENISELSTKKHFGFSDGELKMIELLADRLKAIEGK